MYKLILVASTALAVSACTYSSYGPADDRSMESSGLVASRHIDVTGDAEFSGMMVNARGDVGRNLELSGATVRADADVGGNLEAAGARVRFRGTVGGDADVSAATMHLNAEIAGDLSVAGARVTIDGTVRGRTEMHAARMNLRGDFLGPVEIIGEGTEESGRLIFSGHFAEGAVICATEIEFRSGARLSGDVTIYSETRPSDSAGSFNFIELDGRDCDKMDL